MEFRRKKASLLLALLLILLSAGSANAAESNAVQYVKVDVHHLLLEADTQDLLKVREVLKVNNTGNAVPSQKFTLTISPDRLGSGYKDSKSGFHSLGHLQKWANSPLSGTNPHIWVAAIMLISLAAAVGGGYYFRQKRLIAKEQEQQEKMAHLLDDLYIRQKRLLDKIDALDQKHELTQLEHEEYTSLRNQYIAKLTKIKLKIREQELLEE